MRRRLAALLLLLLALALPAQATDNPEGFIAFPATEITTDTATAAFDATRYSAAYVRFNIVSLGLSNTIRLQVQALMPDATWRTIANSTAETVAADYLYYVGTGASKGALIGQTLNTPIPKVWRINIDQSNGAASTVAIYVVPVDAKP